MKKYPNYRSVRYEYSLEYFIIRSDKDALLFDDVENFIAKHNTGSGDLVDKLLNKSFSHARYTDHEYPF